MAYIGKTNWQNNEIVEASDMNRIEQGILDVDVELGEVAQELAAHKADNTAHGVDTKIPKSLATAADQFLVSSGAGSWVIKTVEQIKTLLGLKSAAYTESSAYATAAQGTKADNALPKSLATAANQFLVSSGASNWVIKTIAQVKELLGLKSAAYTESSAYAPSSHINVSASTSAKGHVQLTDSVSSTSTTTAATPNSVKQAYDKANAALPKSGGTMTGVLTAQSNTSYTVRQVRNIILSTADADVNAMQNGDIWIKYK